MCTLLLIDTDAKEREKKAKEMATIVQTIMDHSHDLIGAQWCSLFVVDEEKQELWSKVVTDRNGKVSDTKLITVPLSNRSIAGEVYRTQKVIIIPDVYKDPRFYQAVDDKMMVRTRNMLAVPVLGEKDGKPVVRAVIEMMNKNNGDFDAADEKLCTMLAHHVSLFLKQLDV